MEENFNEAPKRKVENYGAMSRGVLLGVLSTILVMAVILCVTVVVLLQKGYLHISTDGSVN